MGLSRLIFLDTRFPAQQPEYDNQWWLGSSCEVTGWYVSCCAVTWRLLDIPWVEDGTSSRGCRRVCGLFFFFFWRAVDDGEKSKKEQLSVRRHFVGRTTSQGW